MHATHCAEMYLQCGLEETRANMLLELAVQILKEPCFHALRTQEQLGYIVFSGVRRVHGAQGLRFIVQSEKHPSYVDTRVEAFLHSMEVRDEGRMTLALSDQLTRLTVSIKAAHRWRTIESFDLLFDRRLAKWVS